MDTLPERSYLLLPFFKSVAFSASPLDTGKVYVNNSIEDNDAYRLFCIKTKLEVVLPGVYLSYRSYLSNNRLQTVLYMSDGTSPYIMSEEAYKKTQACLDDAINLFPKEACIWSVSDQTGGVPGWYQNWMLPTIEEWPKGIQVRLVENHQDGGNLQAYASLLSHNQDYLEVYHLLVEFIYKELEYKYSHCYVKCSEKDAQRLKLTRISTNASIYAPDWDTRTFLPSVGKLEYLINLLWDSTKTFEENVNNKN